jgi:FixJ family two-component response regulator
LPKLPIISIIDDDDSVRAATDTLLRSHGYAAYTFASAEEFLGSTHLNDTSCVVTDIRMLAMSGIELQTHLLERGYEVPFIFITALPDERIRAQALKAGAVGFLTKPFDEGTFLRYLKEALHKYDETCDH